MIISDDDLYYNDGTKVQFEDEPDAAVNQSMEQLEFELNLIPQSDRPTPPPIPLYDLSLRTFTEEYNESFNPASAGLFDYRVINKSVIPMYKYQTNKQQYDRCAKKKN